MITEENKTEIIDQYLAGSLSAELRHEVEERLKTDSEFKRDVAIQQKVIQTIQRMGRESFRKELAELSLGVELPEAGNMPMMNRRPLYYAAAAVALLMVAGLFWLLNKRPPTETYRGYVAVIEIEHSRGSSDVPDSIPITIFKEDDYDFHYQWGDTLMLYGNFAPEDLSVTYENETYFLQIKNRLYPILKDHTIHLLSP
ncbi:MAG: hypothetical protein RIG62_24470 [Cyclobacteriaceae bacterium]|jgi:hypothetical protein